MGVFSIGVLIVGLAAAGVLNVLANSERPTVVRSARILFALGVSASLLAIAALFAAGSSNPNHLLRPTRSGGWAYVVIGAIPMLVVCSLGVRRTFAGQRHRLALAVAGAVAAAQYVAVPFAFQPVGHEPHGLSLWVHDHHVLVVLAFLVPMAILLFVEVEVPAYAAHGVGRRRPRLH